MTNVKVNRVAYLVKTGDSKHNSSNNYSVGSGTDVSVGGYCIVYVCACACMCECAGPGVLKYSICKLSVDTHFLCFTGSLILICGISFS